MPKRTPLTEALSVVRAALRKEKGLEIQDLDAEDFTNPLCRALIVFAQWHMDEVTGTKESLDYARRLILRMQEYRLAPVQSPVTVSFQNVTIGAPLANGVVDLNDFVCWLRRKEVERP